jgi:Flp pilus assembly protein CpaB
MDPRARRLVIAVAIALAAGLAAGYLYQQNRRPTIEERARGAAEQMKGAVEKLTK